MYELYKRSTINRAVFEIEKQFRGTQSFCWFGKRVLKLSDYCYKNDGKESFYCPYFNKVVKISGWFLIHWMLCIKNTSVFFAGKKYLTEIKNEFKLMYCKWIMKKIIL